MNKRYTHVELVFYSVARGGTWRWRQFFSPEHDHLAFRIEGDDE